nr:hypothetical protein Iba_chr15dCG8150 [Ipomoea batatas]
MSGINPVREFPSNHNSVKPSMLLSSCGISPFTFFPDSTLLMILGGIVVLQFSHSHCVGTQGSPPSSVQPLPTDMERRAFRAFTSKQAHHIHFVSLFI